MRRRTAALALAVCMAMLAACQPGTSPTPTPTSSPTATSPMPTPTYLCTPEAGAEQAPCTQLDYEEMKAKDALYAEAEAVFREFHEERVRISRAGGVREPTEVILATTHGDARESVMESVRGMVERGTHAEGEDPILSVTRSPGVARAGSIVTLLACLDASGWAFYRGKEVVSQGEVGENRVYFSRVEGTLKMSYIEGRWVESCDQ